MSTAYGSIDSDNTTFDITGDLVITKPSGLSEGDFMVAILQIGNASGGLYTLSGWTDIGNLTGASHSVTVLVKVATSGDAAASNFTFTPAGTGVGGTDKMSGCIVRVTGTSFTDSNNAFTSLVLDGAATTHTFSNGVVPFSTGSLFILAGCNSQTNSGAQSGYAITNNNPTWTERLDLASAGGSIGLATATPSAASDTGDSTVVYTNSEASVGVIVVVQEDTSVTATHAHLAVTPSFTAPVARVGVTATHAHLAVTPTFTPPTAIASSPTQWTHKTKPSDTWTNESKL